MQRLFGVFSRTKDEDPLKEILKDGIENLLNDSIKLSSGLDPI